MKFCFLDTETTSADPDRGVCEVGLVFTDDRFNILSEKESLIDPQMMISPSASGVHGLTYEDVRDAPTLDEFFSDASEDCLGGRIEGPVAVFGHRVSFDLHTVQPYIDGEVYPVDSLRWARRLYPDAEDHKLSTLMFSLALPRPTDAHRALADVYSAMHLVKHICERTGLTLPELVEASKGPFELKYVPFGKHKGQAFSEIPRSYLQWMRGMKDLDADMQYTLNLALNNKKNK